MVKYIFFKAKSILILSLYANFLRISNNKFAEIMNIIFLLILSGVLYSQTLFGPNWFIPIKDITEYNFYIDEKELRKIKKKETDSLECLICLLPIIPINIPPIAALKAD